MTQPLTTLEAAKEMLAELRERIKNDWPDYLTTSPRNKVYYDQDMADLARWSAAIEADGWQPMATAPRDGTKVDLWGVNLLLQNLGERIVNVPFGTVRDWLGREREDWQTGRGEDFQVTHWMPLPPPPKGE